MKKILLTFIIGVLTVSFTFAYTQKQLDESTANYKVFVETKIWPKLATLWEEKLRKILPLVDTLVKKYELSTTLSDSKKLQKIAILLAFKEVISEKLEDEFSDINSILNVVNTKYGPVFVISDTRCWDVCKTEELISSMRGISWLKDAKIVELDFSSTQAKDLLKTTWITVLPAVIFPDNSVEELSIYLKPTNNKNYSLELWSTFNPYESRSAKWFKLLDQSVLWVIKKDSYIKWNTDAKILWLEYSDMECPFCAKLHNSWTIWELEKKYWTQLAYSLQHFPLNFHKNAFTAAQYLECTWKLKWENTFYRLKDKIFTSQNSSVEFIVTTAVWELSVDNKLLIDCVESKEFDAKITAQQKRWTSLFWVTWTPGNVLINTITWEYEVISWAYPTTEFVKIIDRLLK